MKHPQLLTRRDTVSGLLLVASGIVAASTITESCEAADPGMRRIDLSGQWDDQKVLKNPHKGWYHHYFDNGTGIYLTRADSDLDSFPGMNHLYLRVPWSYLEPTKGQYQWSLLDTVINKWTAKGYGISLCVTCKETDTIYATPEWVKNAGAQGAFFTTSWGSTAWRPDYGDAIFLQNLDRKSVV